VRQVWVLVAHVWVRMVSYHMLVIPRARAAQESETKDASVSHAAIVALRPRSRTHMQACIKHMLTYTRTHTHNTC